MQRVWRLPVAAMLWVVVVGTAGSSAHAQPAQDTAPAGDAPPAEPSSAPASPPESATPSTVDEPPPAVDASPPDGESTATLEEPSAALEAPSAAPTTEHVEAPTSTRMQAPVVVEVVPQSSERVGYDDGFFIESADGDNRLTLSAYAQTRLTHLRPDGEDSETMLRLPRTRIGLHGHVHSPRFAYRFEAAFDHGVAGVRDAYLDYALVSDWPRLRVGNQRRPFSRQRITPGGELALITRATTQVVGVDRDLGVVLHNGYDQSPRLEYALGVFHGGGALGGTAPRVVLTSVEVDPVSGDRQLTEIRGPAADYPTSSWNPTVVVRVGYNYNGIDGYREADFRGGDLRAAIGLAGQLDLHGGHVVLAEERTDDDTRMIGTVDYMLKVDGFSTSGGIRLSSVQNGPDLGDRVRADTGLHAQAGYLIGGVYQPAFRYALHDPQWPLDRQLQEIAVGLSLYAVEHAVKWQTQWTLYVSEDDAGDRISHVVDTQLQFGF